MKEKDLDICLDNVIIDGLIKEAEYENADFANAMRNISDEDFAAIVRQPEYAGAFEETVCSPAAAAPTQVRYSLCEGFKEERAREPEPVKKSVRLNLRPWIISAISAAAIILAVVIPSYSAMNARLCESALYASEAYITPAKGCFDISTATPDQIKQQLPQLRKEYESKIHVDGKLTYHSEGFDEAGWNLAVAYLKLHKKGDAVEVLRELSKYARNPEISSHCAKLLEQLD